MPEVISAIAKTPVPTILIVAGIVFLLLAIADKIYGEIRVSASRRKQALIVGVILLSLGLLVQLAPIVIPKKITAISTDTDWRKSDKVGWVLNARLRPSINCGKYSLLSKANSLPQSDLLCMYQNLADADRSMGDYYREYRNALPTADRPELTKQQRAWVIDRNIACPVSWSDLETAGIADSKAHCLLESTNERTSHIKTAMEKIGNSE